MTRLQHCAVAVLVMLAACGPRMQGVATAAPDSADWVNRTLRSLTLEQKIGQLLMMRLEGDFENVNGPGMRRAERLIRQYEPGGFALGIGGPADVALKANTLQGFSRLPLLIAADLEWGAGMRLWRPTYLPYGMEGGGGTAFPFNMGIGATGTPALADTAGRITGTEARAVGINWIFAPVLDLNTDPANPIVNVRAYGSNSDDVARFGAAFIRGATRARVLTAAKHFPGHGETHLDSHVDLPVLEISRARLDSVELEPFRAGMNAGVSAVMTGHLAIPAVIGDRITPATISPRVGRDIVRDQLGFDGIVVTDAMTMGALRKVPGYTPGEIAVRAVEAGADVVLGPPSLEQAHAALLAAVRAGRISEARIDSSVARILGAKAWLGIHHERLVDLARVNQLVASPAHEAAAARIAQRSITLARDSAALLPLDPRENQQLALIAFSAPNDVNAGRTLANELRAIYGPRVTLTRLDESLASEAYDRAVASARGADAVIFATFLMPIAGQGHIRVPTRAEEIAARIAQLGKPTVVASFGDPYGPARLPLASTYLIAWQPRSLHAQVAAARAIAGVAPITGTLPIDLAGLPRGSGLKRGMLNTELSLARPEDVGMDAGILARVDSIIMAALADRAAPGAAVAVGRHGRLVKLEGYGRLDYRDGFASVTDSSIYDLASLTKVVGMTTATMMLIDDGRIDLDAPLTRYLPELQQYPDMQAITVRNVLLHNAGFRAFAPLYRTAKGRQEYLNAIAALPLDYPTGTRTTYSDFGPILLGIAIERLTGQTLDQFLSERLFEPLGMRDTYFNPAASLLPRIAPTEVDTTFRRRQLHGSVHDENAFAIGGVSGHAGLFSSARDLAKFAQMLLNGGYYGGKRYISPNTLALFTRRQNEGASRALGWDTPAPNSSGEAFSSSAFGHTGFTGTSMWLDPRSGVFVILLTNRVNPTRENQKHVPLRRALAEAVQTSTQ
ncbi:MAG: glycoside hydrolase family 3 N-terminal domain-containing protein [Gemmatimonadota bacterium]